MRYEGAMTTPVLPASGRIVLFGATGYTGGLTLDAMVRRGLRPVVAGRDVARVEALAGPLGLEHAVADVRDAVSVASLVHPGDVLVTTVGPFVKHGLPALEAAVEVGAHYLDSTGEGPFVRTVFEHHGPRAQARGVALLTAFGYDFVPGNLAAGLALEHACRAGALAAAVEVGYFLTGTASMSGGTRASAFGVVGGSGFTVRHGHLVDAAPGTGVVRLPAGGRMRSGVTISATEHLALPRIAPSLERVDVGLGWFGSLSTPMAWGTRALRALDAVPPVRGAVHGLLGLLAGSGSSGGPDADARARSGSLVVAEVKDVDGHVVAHVELVGPNGYTLTGDLLAWGAAQAAAGRLTGAGALGPVDGFGLEALTAGAASCGLREESAARRP